MQEIAQFGVPEADSPQAAGSDRLFALAVARRFASSVGMVYPGDGMTTQDWITLIACVGELAVAALVFLRALGSPLAMPLLLFSVDLVVWNFARLAYQRTGAINWHLLDMVTSPIGTALAFLFLLRFVGRARQMRWVLRTDYVLNGVLSGAALLALFLPWPERSRCPKSGVAVSC